MKKLLIPMIVVVALTTSCKTEKKTEAIEEVPVVVDQVLESPITLEGATHTADLAMSSLTWKGYKPTGSHNGTLNLNNGAVRADENGIQEGLFTIDMKTLTVKDIPAESEDNEKLRGHLSSADFFDVENHPTATFVFSKVENNTLMGELTIKGISKPLDIPVSITEKDGITYLKAAPFKIDRTAYDIRFKSKKFFDDLKDKFINDEFEVSFDIALKK